MKRKKPVNIHEYKIKIRKNDQVMVITGKSEGKKGKVLKIFPKTNRAIVEGINFIKKAQRPTQRTQKGGIVEKEGTIHISNLKLLCKHCSKAVRLGRRILEDGSIARICRSCGEIIDR